MKEQAATGIQKMIRGRQVRQKFGPFKTTKHLGTLSEPTSDLKGLEDLRVIVDH